MVSQGQVLRFQPPTHIICKECRTQIFLLSESGLDSKHNYITITFSKNNIYNMYWYKYVIIPYIECMVDVMIWEVRVYGTWSLHPWYHPRPSSLSKEHRFHLRETRAFDWQGHCCDGGHWGMRLIMMASLVSNSAKKTTIITLYSILVSFKYGLCTILIHFASLVSALLHPFAISTLWLGLLRRAFSFDGRPHDNSR